MRFVRLLLGLVVFAAGVVLMWFVGSLVVGGGGFPGMGGNGSTAPTPELTSQPGYAIGPQLDLRTFRDLAYVPVRGLYVTSYAAGNSTMRANVIKIADQTEINALVIDVKDATGYVSYDTQVPLAKELGLAQRRIKDIDGLTSTLVAHKITPIARIVCFQDPVLAKKRPDLAVKSKKTGENWLDDNKSMYINPYKREVWEYLVELGEEAAHHGFREIQFDYVRFPSDGPISDAVYPGAGSSQEDAIAAFLGFARERLEKLGVWVSADVFGLTVHATNDGGIGQKVEKVAANVDIVCPMLYPSHYDTGSYGFTSPNAHPYEIVSAALADTKKRLAGTGAMGRPWLQDFTLGSPPYGVEEVKAEIKAAKDQGFQEWILWNAGVKYTVGALKPEQP